MLFQRRRIDTESPYSDPDKLRELLQGGEPHCLVDVRTAEEYQAGHIPTARFIPHDEIARRPPTRDRDQLIVVYCAAGVRGSRAKRRLASAGYRNVVNFGGLDRWNGDLEYDMAGADS